MQQTTSRKLSIIESSDPFLPEALNDNTRKIEAALDSHETRTQAVTDALDQRVTVLEGRKMAWGIYTGDGQDAQFIPLPFTPKAVFIQEIAYAQKASMVIGTEPGIQAQLTEGGFNALLRYTSATAIPATNTIGTRYTYLAFC